MLQDLTNPYVQLLIRSLNRLDVEVAPLPGRLTPPWLQSNRPSILHFHWPSYGYTDNDRAVMESLLGSWIANLKLANRLGYHIVWTAHNLYPHDGLFFDLQQRARSALVEECSAIIVHCRSALQEMQRAFGRLPALTAVIPHGSYTDCYAAPPAPQDARALLGLSQEAFVYLCFGQLRPYKGIDLLMDSFLSIAGECQCELVIAGYPITAGYGRRLLAAARAKPGIHLHPFFIPDSEVPAYFAAATAVVLPYRSVLSSGAAILAHSMGRPVVAPAIGCLPEMIPPGTGWLYDPGAPLGLQDAMRAALHADPAATAKRCRDFAMSFGWNEVATATRELYLRVSQL